MINQRSLQNSPYTSRVIPAQEALDEVKLHCLISIVSLFRIFNKWLYASEWVSDWVNEWASEWARESISQLGAERYIFLRDDT